MYRISLRTRPLLRFPRPRTISSSRKPIINSTNKSVENSQIAPPPIPDHRHTLSPIPPSQSPSRTSVVALSAAVASAVFASAALLSSNYSREHNSDRSGAANPLYAGAEHAARKAAESFDRIFHHAKRTGVAASVLWQSLRSVLSSANHEVRSGFEIRVAALLADIAAANSGRRASIVGAGGGAVVDWLLESVAVAKDGGGTQAESARALAYLIADPNVSAAVLGRPHAVPNLLRFIFSGQPRLSKNKKAGACLWLPLWTLLRPAVTMQKRYLLCHHCLEMLKPETLLQPYKLLRKGVCTWMSHLKVKMMMVGREGMELESRYLKVPLF
ncbi:hypothetical protein E2542_SST14842 [Spatholobus suberectus]|nr:hypothetical protein E2542_SST14842 [Spatholobus suberectus]